MKQEALEVLKKIESFGFQAYIIGGFSRDLYIGKENKDIDICTNATPDKISEIFELKNKIGLNYGSIIINYKNHLYQITTFRKEKKYINNRIPSEVQYVNDLKEDLQRRDFVMNTLCIDSNWNYIDLLDAKKDINNRIINTVGNSDKKIKEDSLRILRAIRFATILNFKLSDELKQSIRKNKNNLRKLSYERKKQELDKIFSNSNVLYGIKLLKELELLEVLDLCDTDIIITKTIGIWFQLDKYLNYPYTIEEKNIIKEIKTLLKQNLNDRYILYKHNIESILITAKIRNLSLEEVKLQYQNLLIKNRKDIKISSYKICDILEIKKRSILKEIYVFLEKNILYEKVKNEEKCIKEFLLNTYKK